MIKIQDNVDKVLTTIRNIEDNVLSDFTNFWGEAQKIVASELKRIFETEGYGTWKPLSERYVRLKPSDKTILRLTDTYYRSATRKGELGNYYIATKDYMEYGIDINWFVENMGHPYPSYHETGTNKMPSRPVFGLLRNNKEIIDLLMSALKLYLKKQVENQIYVRE